MCLCACMRVFFYALPFIILDNQMCFGKFPVEWACCGLVVTIILICSRSFDVISYSRYINNDRVTLDFSGMVDDLTAAPDRSIVLLHACAHNPTGSVYRDACCARLVGEAAMKVFFSIACISALPTGAA